MNALVTSAALTTGTATTAPALPTLPEPNPTPVITSEDPIFAAIKNWEKESLILDERIKKLSAIQTLVFQRSREASTRIIRKHKFSVHEMDGKQCFSNWKEHDRFNVLHAAARKAIEEECGKLEAERLVEEALDAEQQAIEVILTTTPTSREGAIALLQWAEDDAERGGYMADVNREELIALMGSLKAFLAGGAH